MSNEKGYRHDFHTHTLASDGVLLHPELVYRALEKGVRTLAFSDHAAEADLEAAHAGGTVCPMLSVFFPAPYYLNWFLYKL